MPLCAVNAGSPRLVSLDALRGFTMIWITGFEQVVKALAAASGVSFLKKFSDQLWHNPWTPGLGRLAAGFHCYDMVMPLFLFCAGTSLPFSFAKRLARGEGKRKIYAHLAKRFALLFVLGMAMDNLFAFDFAHLHFFSDTLQAIACGYLIAALLLLHLRARGQAAAVAGLLLGYWALLTFIPAPGQPHGVLTPDANLAIYLDKILLGRHQDGTYYTWILTSLGFGSTVALGALAGQWLQSSHAPTRKILGLWAAGVALVVAGLVWSLSSPIIKYIWSSSFVLFSGGICLLLLAAFYLVIDAWGLWRWAFVFVVIGANSIVAYMAGRFINFKAIAANFVGGTEHWLGLWYAVLHLALAFALFWLMLYGLYRKKTFVRV